MENPKWDAENIATLRDLAKSGLTCRQMAAELKFNTRNAIIGKLHRLGITGMNANHGPSTGRPFPQKPRHRVKGGTIKPTSVNAQRIAGTHLTKKKLSRIALTEAPPAAPPCPPLVFTPTEYDTSIPPEQRRTLVQLNNHTCRWPIGSPSQPGFFFCGGYTDYVYCPHHAKRAWRP